jgi:hypothetical protein
MTRDALRFFLSPSPSSVVGIEEHFSTIIIIQYANVSWWRLVSACDGSSEHFVVPTGKLTPTGMHFVAFVRFHKGLDPSWNSGEEQVNARSLINERLEWSCKAYGLRLYYRPHPSLVQSRCEILSIAILELLKDFSCQCQRERCCVPATCGPPEPLRFTLRFLCSLPWPLSESTLYLVRLSVTCRT